MGVLYKKLNFDKKEIELIKYNSKLDRLPEGENALLRKEIFVRKKIEDIKKNILQLENNLQFFTNIDEKHPLMKEALKSIQEEKDNLVIWEEKLKELHIHESKE